MARETHLLRKISAFASVLVLATGASSLSAQPASDADRARLHFQTGASYYDAGDYEDALREFQRAHALSQKSELYYNFSLCYQQMGDLEKAIDYLSRYLQEVQEVPNRASLERRLENLRERHANAGREPDPETDPETGPEADPTNPDEASEGSPETESSTAESSEAGAGSADGASSGGRTNIPAIIGFSAAGVGVVLAATFGALALKEKGNLEERGCGERIACDAGKLRTRALLSDLGLALAVAGAALGTVFLIIWGGDDDDDEEQARVVPWVSPDGAGAALGGRF